jgi:hypothetical protein
MRTGERLGKIDFHGMVGAAGLLEEGQDVAGALRDEGGDVVFSHEQIGKRGAAEDGLENELDGVPEGAERAIRVVAADILTTGVSAAELGAEEAAAEDFHDLSDLDLVGRARKRIPSGLATHALDEFAHAHEAHEFGDVGNGKSFGGADLGDCEGGVIAPFRKVEKAAEAVFFLGTQLHGIILALIV